MALISDIKFTNKWLDVIRDKSSVIFLEGVTGSGKSLLSSLKLYFDVMSLPKGKNKAILIGQSRTKLEKDFVNQPDGLGILDLFSNVKYNQHGVGGARFEIDNGDEIKIIELLGYDNASRYKELRGKGFTLAFLDEGNLAPENYIEELFTALARNDSRLIVTSNGDDPDIPFYRKYMDKCYPVEKYKDNIPDSTIQYLSESEDKDKDYHYYFFGHEDNPKNTIDKIKRLYKSVPKGSYRYITKILGERGVATGLCFREYMSPNMFITQEEFNKLRITDMYIGMDHGAKDLTVFTLVAITSNNQVIVVDTTEANQCDDEQLYNHFKQWFTSIYDTYKGKIRAIYIDPAALSTKLYFNKRTRIDYRIPVESAWKFGDHDIKNRVELNQQLIHLNKLLFLNKGKPIYDALGKIKYSEKANEIVDRSHQHDSVDRWDSFNYGISRHHIQLFKQ